MTHQLEAIATLDLATVTGGRGGGSPAPRKKRPAAENDNSGVALAG